MGEPREPVPPTIRDHARSALGDYMPYPRTVGREALRQAIAGWANRRFAVDLDPACQILPTSGSKEAIFSLALLLVDAASGRDLVVTTTPGYPIPAAGALYAGARLVELPLLEENGFVPDLDAIAPDDWERIAVFWINYPNNPTGATLSQSLLAGLGRRAREYDFVLACDEAYWELWLDQPSPSAFELADLENVLVFGSLSKRGAMPGYRSGFVAGDQRLIEALRSFRSQTGTTSPEFIQAAAAAAWADDEMPARLRERLGHRRAILENALQDSGFRCTGDTCVFIWAAVPPGATSAGVAERLISSGVLTAPGPMFGPSGEGYVRVAAVATDAEVETAADLIRSLSYG
jgi:acetylornithine aminotransferase